MKPGVSDDGEPEPGAAAPRSCISRPVDISILEKH